MVIFHSYVSFPEGMFTHMLHGAGILDYLTTGDFARTNVGKYSSTMEHMGYVCLCVPGIIGKLGNFGTIHQNWPKKVCDVFFQPEKGAIGGGGLVVIPSP